MRGGYASSSFWRSGRDAKLEHIASRSDDWLMLHVVWVALLVVAAGGMTGACFVVARAGEEALAAIGLGVFARVLALRRPTPGAARCARRSHPEGSGQHAALARATVRPVGWAEVTYVVGTSASYVILGTAMVASEVPATWAGGASILVGALAALGVRVAREWVTFPVLPLIVPIVLGVAFLLA